MMSLHQRLVLSRACSQSLQSYLESCSVWKLQLGTGMNFLNGWFNTDIAPSSARVFFLDATNPFPFEDATFHYIFSEHHLEHLVYTDGLFTLRECYRVLKPEGKIRIATPSLEAILNLHSSTLDDIQQRYIQFITDRFLPQVHCYNSTFVINNAFHDWGHQFLYDRVTLQNALEEVGFVDITLALPGESNEEHLRGIERHGQFIGDEEINRYETMILEGRRPS